MDDIESFASSRRLQAVKPSAKISVRNLSFFYGRTQALKNVGIDILDCSILALVGPSGCGKSTLLRIFNRMYDLYPYQTVDGEVIIDGENILTSHIDLQILRTRLGMVFQKPTPFPASIYENVIFGARLHERLSKAEKDERVEWALARSSLWDEVKDILNKSAMELSGGQQQRLCIARAIAMRPDILLLDEPTSALDPISTAKIEDLMDKLKQELCVVLVTHNLQQAARCADDVAFLYQGELVEHASANQIFTNPRERKTQEYVTGRFG